MQDILIQPISRVAFAPFGEIIAADTGHPKMINAGLCARHHDLARVETDQGRAGISLFQSELRSLPLVLDLMERHPEGSQAFIPMCQNPFLVVVAEDAGGHPATPQAFRTETGMGVNFHKNTWHGVLTPLAGSGLFAVIDQIGDTPNLEEHYFKTPYRILES